MNKYISLIIFLGSNVVFANQNVDDLNAKRMAWANEYLKKQGLPTPDGGVKVIPENKMASYASKKEEREQFKKDVQTLGYIKLDHPSTNQLLALGITSKRDLKNHGEDFDPKSTHMKINVNDLKMAYSPTLVPSLVAGNYIGAAPYLTYLKDQGWVGVIQFFNNKLIGNCSFSENNIKLSHGSVIIAEEDVRKDVGGKITTVQVMGTPDSGFTYTVEWFDDAFFRKVECANENYSAELTNTVIKIAQSIDNG